MPPAPLIQLDHVTKVFPTDGFPCRALFDLHLAIEGGEYLAVTGPAGCGKSTLLSILGLLEAATDGTYRLDELDVQDLPLPERARIRHEQVAFVHPTANLIGGITVHDNVELPLISRGWPAVERAHQVQAVLERAGLEAYAPRLPSALSAGQQQRAAVARALAGRPSVLLVDEPAANLTPEDEAMLLELLDDLHRTGLTVVLATRDARIAHRADRVLLLTDGHMAEEPGEAGSAG